MKKIKLKSFLKKFGSLKNLLYICITKKEAWQNGNCNGLENRRPSGHVGSTTTASAILILNK